MSWEWSSFQNNLLIQFNPNQKSTGILQKYMKNSFKNLYRIMKDHEYPQEPWTKRNIAKVSPRLIACYSMGTIIIKQQNASLKLYT